MSGNKKRGLGRGLGALITTSDAEQAATQGLRLVPVTQIQPNPHQPRTIFDETKLQELSDSIKEHGLIQPLIVQQVAAEEYYLIAGERRWRASQMAGLTELPVVIKDATPQAMLEMAIIENVQRADLNILEEAVAYKQLMDEFGLTQKEVAERVGKARTTIANTVRLLDLAPEAQNALNARIISAGHARSLLSLPTPEQQTAIMSKIIDQGLNVRQTEALVRKLLTTEPAVRKEMPKTEIRAMETRIQESIGAQVSVKKGKRGGKVVIHFYSEEELQTIYAALTKKRQK